MYVTATELARRHHVTLQTILNWLAQTPAIHPRRAGRVYLLSETDVQAILGRPRKKMGRPKKVVDTTQ
jgi:hypothetical protein